MAKGIIYIMTTAIPGLIKIGITDNFNQRMTYLEGNGYKNATGLKREFAIEVEDYQEKELLLDNVFSKSRVGSTELFSLDVNIAKQLLSAFEGKQVYPTDATKQEVFSEATEAVETEGLPDGEYVFNTKKYTGILKVEKGILTLKAGALLGDLSDKATGAWIKIRKSLKTNGNYLAEDVVCSSPSQAATLLSGSNKDGWVCWRNEKNETIDIYREKNYEE